MPQSLSALAVFEVVPGSVISSHMVAHNYPYLKSQGIWHPILVPVGSRYTCDTYMQEKYSYALNKNK